MLMAKKKTIIPITPLCTILRKEGAERISKEAREDFTRVVEEYAEKVARRSVEIARHVKRKTIFVEDIKLAKQSL